MKLYLKTESGRYKEASLEDVAAALLDRLNEAGHQILSLKLIREVFTYLGEFKG